MSNSFCNMNLKPWACFCVVQADPRVINIDQRNLALVGQQHALRPVATKKAYDPKQAAFTVRTIPIYFLGEGLCLGSVAFLSAFHTQLACALLNATEYQCGGILCLIVCVLV